MSRPFDIVLWGCTGFTGKLVAEYFARDVSPKHPDLKWALAGRSREKVLEVKSHLCKEWPGVDPEVCIGTSEDQASVDAVVSQCRVLISTAGPYLTRGTPVVDACVRLGTDYVDITGEPAWVADLLDKYHHQAVANNVLIVPMSGYDSIPSDLGVLFAVNSIRDKFGQPTRRAQSLAEMDGDLSGGTLATSIEMGRDFPEHLQRQDDPFCLGGGTLPRPEDEDQYDARFNDDLKVWTNPFMMAKLNTRVVRRSNALLHYGTGFSYGESQWARDEASAQKAAKSAQAQQANLANMWKVSDKLRQSGRLPKQGEGPSVEKRSKSWFCHHIVATAADGRKVICEVRGGDPGYTETAKMLSESALCLLHDRNQLAYRGGVLTPAAAGGMVLVKRLQNRGITFKVVGEMSALSSKL